MLHVTQCMLGKAVSVGSGNDGMFEWLWIEGLANVDRKGVIVVLIDSDGVWLSM